MQFWRGPECVERVADQSHAYRRYAGGEYHGSHPAGEYHALRYVPEPGQPDGGGGYRRCTGGVDAYAVHTGHGNTLDTRCADHALGNMPSLDSNCTLMCNWAGVIKVVMPGQMQMLIP